MEGEGWACGWEGKARELGGLKWKIVYMGYTLNIPIIFYVMNVIYYIL